MMPVKVTTCDYPGCGKTAPPSKIKIAYEGPIKGYDLCQTHQDAIDKTLAPLITGQKPERSRRTSSADRSVKAGNANKAANKRATHAAETVDNSAAATSGPPSGGAAGAKEATSANVRAWAIAQGKTVPARGRMPADVVAEFIAAGSPS